MPPPQGLWQTLACEKYRAGKKRKVRKTPIILVLVNRARQRTKGNITNRQKPKHKAPSRKRRQFVVRVYTYSISRFSLLVRLVRCYAVCRLRPAFVNYAQPLGVRQYETSRAGSASTHATRHLQYGSSIGERKSERNKMKITEDQRKKEKKT